MNLGYKKSISRKLFSLMHSNKKVTLKINLLRSKKLLHFALLTIGKSFSIHLGMMNMMLVSLSNPFWALHQEVTQSMMTMLLTQKAMNKLMMF